jgi:RHH-type proline utilization regulon transcriptional repressor/proline dehydrogenase/delta 1-pyrroline-5-carboxylate dehydrogenase
VLRFVPAAAEVRVGEGAAAREVRRVGAAAALASPGSLVTFSTPPAAELATELSARGLRVAVEDDETWVARVTSARTARVRAVGIVPVAARVASVTIFDDPVTASGRLELFPFLREQAISITAHRFGTPSPLAYAVDVAASRSPS